MTSLREPVSTQDFELDNDPDSDAEARISLRGSESCFTIGTPDHGIGYTWREVVGDRLGLPYERESRTWLDLEKRVSSWLREVKDDIETPDLWDELQRERKVLAAAPAEGAENAPFTVEEQAEIAKQLREIKEYVKQTYALSEKQAQALEAKLDYLEEAAGRLGRFDWRNVALATLFAIAAEAIVPPDDVRRLLLRLLEPLGHLFGHPFPELPSG